MNNKFKWRCGKCDQKKLGLLKKGVELIPEHSRRCIWKKILEKKSLIIDLFFSILFAIIIILIAKYA